ncbi:MAG: DNA polymerase III subunit chi [Pseudomonadota bacterium]
MPKVDFYMLHTRADRGLERFACQLANKAWNTPVDEAKDDSPNNRIYIHCMSREQAIALDKLLWTYQDISFVPHDLFPDVQNSVAPIRIGYTEDRACEDMDVLINLSLEVPIFFEKFRRIAEVVDEDAAVLAAAKNRCGFYWDHGDNIQIHHIQR